MKWRRIGIVVTALALGLALAPGSAWANKSIKVSYETFDKAGTLCVKDKPTIKKNDKSLRIKKLSQNIEWQLEKTKGQDAGGTWEVRKLLTGANKSVDICPEIISFDANGKATCVIGTDLQYSYDLIWKKAGCDEVKADPVIIFEGGGGDTMLPFFPWPFLSLALAAGAAYALGTFVARKRRK